MVKTPQKPVRLVIADDEALVRRGLEAYITANQRLQLLGEAQNGQEALQLCELFQPQVVLMDADMPGMNGLEVTRAIRQRWPQTRVLVLTSASDQIVTQDILDTGAAGHITKDISAEELAQAILQALEDQPVVTATGETQAKEPSELAGDLQPLKVHTRVYTTPQPRTIRELEMAGRIQFGILPESPPSLPGWDLSATLEPAGETSGDFYDFIPLPNNKWGIVIADVTDKGLGAALFMTLSSSLLRTYAARFPTLPAMAINAVNNRIFADTRGGMFVTTFYAVLEPDIGRLRYVNAGHNPPFLASSQKGKPTDRLTRTGVALGLFEEQNWQQKMMRFSPGDVLVLYTDGVTEAYNRRGQFFGESRLQQVVRLLRERPASEIQEGLLAEVNEFTGRVARHDDIALIVLKKERDGI
jgi:serine phosphatase RsbU (regulator of sigma subunit)